MENPCGKSFSRGVASALVCSGAAIAVVMAALEEVVFMLVPWHASRKRAAWPRAGDRSPRRPVQFQWSEYLGCNRKAVRPLARNDGRLHDFGIMEQRH